MSAKSQSIKSISQRSDDDILQRAFQQIPSKFFAKNKSKKTSIRPIIGDAPPTQKDPILQQAYQQIVNQYHINILILAHDGVAYPDLWELWLSQFIPENFSLTINVLTNRTIAYTHSIDFCDKYRLHDGRGRPVFLKKTSWFSFSLVVETMKAFDTIAHKFPAQSNGIVILTSGTDIPIRSPNHLKSDLFQKDIYGNLVINRQWCALTFDKIRNNVHRIINSKDYLFSMYRAMYLHPSFKSHIFDTIWFLFQINKDGKLVAEIPEYFQILSFECKSFVEVRQSGVIRPLEFTSWNRPMPIANPFFKMSLRTDKEDEIITISLRNLLRYIKHRLITEYNNRKDAILFLPTMFFRKVLPCHDKRPSDDYWIDLWNDWSNSSFQRPPQTQLLGQQRKNYRRNMSQVYTRNSQKKLSRKKTIDEIEKLLSRGALTKEEIYDRFHNGSLQQDQILRTHR